MMCFPGFDIVLLAGAERRDEHKCSSVSGRKKKTERNQMGRKYVQASKCCGEKNVIYFAKASPFRFITVENFLLEQKPGFLSLYQGL